MSKISFFLIPLILFYWNAGAGLAQDRLNLDFEFIDYDTSLPENWNTGNEGFKISLDSLEKHTGKFCLKMEMYGNPTESFGVFSSTLPTDVFVGKDVEYKGWIKTKEVKSGYAGLWFRVEGYDKKIIEFDNMNDRGLTGNNNWTQVSIKLNTGKGAKKITFGGGIWGEGIVWFDNLELYINGEKYIEIEPKEYLSQKEVAALKKYIYPLRTYEPDGGDTKDLHILNKLIGNSKVVALGEVSHGSSEIFKMKNRIIRYLAENEEFDIFSMEANMPESYKLNDYTIRGEDNPKRLIASLGLWTWNTEEVLNMVEWMHKFNRPNRSIEFTGFDMQNNDGAINELLKIFKENEEVENKITDLKKLLYEIKKQQIDGINVGYHKWKMIDSIVSFLHNSIETSTLNPAEKTWLRQNIVIILQYLDYCPYDGYDWRDKCMADNFMWIKEHNPNSKFVIWAHNVHVMKQDKVMGAYLTQKLDNDYKAFGFTFFDGSFTASDSNGSLTSYEAAQAYPGTLEYLLNQLNEPIFILDLKKIKSDNNKDTEWLMKRLAYRSTGMTGGDKGFWRRKISDDFDYLIFIKTSSPSILLPQ